VLVELKVVEQRYRAVIDVLDGMSVTEVAARNGVTRQTLHAWLPPTPTEGWPLWPTRAPSPRAVPIRCRRSSRPG
jgi:transposase